MLAPTDRIEMLSDRTSNLLELATQKFGALTTAEEKLFRAAANGKLADYSADSEKVNDPATAENWGKERLLNANRIAWLCTDPQASVLVTHRGIWIKGARIDGELDLQFAKISFPLFFEKSAFPEGINLRHAEIRALAFPGTHIGLINADGLKVGGGVFLRKRL